MIKKPGKDNTDPNNYRLYDNKPLAYYRRFQKYSRKLSTPGLSVI